MLHRIYVLAFLKPFALRLNEHLNFEHQQRRPTFNETKLMAVHRKFVKHIFHNMRFDKALIAAYVRRLFVPKFKLVSGVQKYAVWTVRRACQTLDKNNNVRDIVLQNLINPIPRVAWEV